MGRVESVTKFRDERGVGGETIIERVVDIILLIEVTVLILTDGSGYATPSRGELTLKGVHTKRGILGG